MTDTAIEKLAAVALIRAGVTESRGFKSHSDLRRALGDEDPYTKNPDDEEGFVTSTGRFVDRLEAVRVGLAAGQCRIQTRPLLSSDIDQW